jgi:CBS domain-containing protein
MHASDLAVPFPAVEPSTPAAQAAQLLANQRLPGLIVVDEFGSPLGVLPGTRLVALALPQYVIEDPALAGVVDESAADASVRLLGGRTVQDCLRAGQGELPVVRLDATVLEIAALMARTGSPLVAVTDDADHYVGAVLVGALLDLAVSG